MRRVVVILAATLLALVLDDASVGAVACGDVVTSSIVLDADLTCATDGLIVQAPDVTIDLGGHTIRTSGSGDGIRNDVHPRMTVKNGTLENFVVGVRVGFFAAGATLTGLTVRGGQTGIALDSPGVVKGNVLLDLLAYGVFVTSGAVVTKNACVSNGLSGIYLEGEKNVVRKNTVVSSGQAGIDDQGSGNTITANVISASGEDGIRLANRILSVVAKNTIRGSARYGIFLDGTESAVVRSNVATGNGSNGIAVQVSASDNTIEKNTVTDNRASGIFVAAGSERNALRTNVARRNALVGIDAAGAATVLAKNRADQNGAGGIAAVAGVADGGGNKARDNAGVDCSGVLCRR